MILRFLSLNIICAIMLFIQTGDIGATSLDISAIKIINLSDAIIIGSFVGSPENLYFYIEEVIKGELQVGTKINVEFYSRGDFFDKSGFFKNIGTDKIILLGKYDSTKNIFILTSSAYGVWPQGNKFLSK